MTNAELLLHVVGGVPAGQFTQMPPSVPPQSPALSMTVPLSPAGPSPSTGVSFQHSLFPP